MLETVNYYPRALKKLGAAAVVCNGQGNVLMVKHSYGMRNWELPGGAAEESESITETAVREVFEETGLFVAAKRLTGIYYDQQNDSHHFVYVCVQTQKDQIPWSVSKETTDCGFFAPDALPRPISDFTVLRIRHALKGGGLELPTKIGPRVWLE